MALAASLAASGRRVGVIDGGLGTHLETGLGQNISSSLWSAGLLQDDASGSGEAGSGNAAIVQAHLDFLHAGAELIGSCNYQTAHQTFARIGLGAAEAERLMLHAISLAAQARSRFRDSAAGKAYAAAGNTRPLIALSLGPYGAMLSNGAEYTGVYPSPADAGAEMSMQELVAFHAQRLRPFAHSAEAWEAIDVLALETLPRADEALACRLALQQVEEECLAKDAAWQRKDLLVSFVFPSGERLPWPAAKRSLEQEIESLLDATLGAAGEASAPPGAAAIGINCTKPHFLAPLVAALTTALARRTLAARPHLFLYPDGGQVYDGINKTWSPGPGVPIQHTTPEGWAEALLASARPAIEEAAWGGVWLGGCCKNGDTQIAELSRRVLALQQ